MLETWGGFDWSELFVPDKSPVEIIVRGTIMYLVLFLLFRFSNKRQLGALGISDLLVVVLVAEASNGGLGGDYSSITDGILLIVTLIFWNYFLNWLDFRFPWFRRLYRPPPLPLIENGEVIAENLRREFITYEELASQLRLQGVNDVFQVREAYLEPDGRISVVSDSAQQRGPPELAVQH